MHAHLAGGDRQGGDRFANDADDLRRVGLEFAAHDLPRQGHGQGQQLALHLGVQYLEWLGQVVEHPGETFDLRANFGAAGRAAFGEPLREGLLVRLRL